MAKFLKVAEADGRMITFLGDGVTSIADLDDYSIPLTKLERPQCTTFKYTDNQILGGLALPPAGSTVDLAFPTEMYGGSVHFDRATFDKLAPSIDGNWSMQMYWRGTLPVTWVATAEIIMDLWKWNNGGSVWVFHEELGRTHALATPSVPDVAIGGAITDYLVGTVSDKFKITLRQTGATPHAFANWNCYWTGHYIDEGECLVLSP